MTNDDGSKQDRLILPLYRNETIEDLQRQGLRIIQKQDGFRFGEDAILLAHGVNNLWDTNRRGACSFVEFGSHCGVVSILFSALSPGAEGIGLELAGRQVELMRRNISLNRLDARLSVLRRDIRTLAEERPDWPEELIPNSYNFVIANPPYGILNEKEERLSASDRIQAERLIARYEIAITFEEMATAAAKLLKSKGKFVFIHRPERLADIFRALEKVRLMPSEMTMIVPREGAAAGLVLIAATKDGRSGGFQVKPQLVVRQSDGSYAAGMRSIYGNPQVLTTAELRENLYEAGEAPEVDERGYIM